MRGLATIMVLPMLAACGNGASDADGDGTISMEEAAREAESGGIKPDPGQYRSTVELVSVDIPNAPPQVVEMMKNSMNGESSEYCLTAEEAEQGFERMARESSEGDCSFERFDADGGDIDAVMVCNQQGGQLRMTMEGTGTRTSSQMRMTMEGDMPGMGEMSMTLTADHERIGDC
ncbi:DUF3617 domain-containing protein [Qipengyuania sp. MTN3-11]|uniref:DUF3617 domain-containing protein n=1 Tax=Qipengyuania sp. MTN3-11 TaxID=3056557 RepID=UPI0036F41B87